MPLPKRTSLLTDPYSTLEESYIRRAYARIGIDDFQLISNTRSKRGNIQDTFATLFQSIAVKCRELNITNYHDYERYVQLIATIKQGIAQLNHETGTYPIPVQSQSGTSSLEPDSQVQSSKDGRGTSSGHPTLEKPSSVVADAKSRPARRGRVTVRNNDVDNKTRTNK